MFASTGPLDSLFSRPEPSSWSLFLADPWRTLAKALYVLRQRLIQPQITAGQALKVACISDTHNAKIDVPAADILVHAGDLTQSGSLPELEEALTWLGSLPHAHKIVIAGNHDAILSEEVAGGQQNAVNHLLEPVTYLDRSSTMLSFAGGRKLLVHGNPLTRRHGSWQFQYEKGQDVFSGTVPDETDILVTHGPPQYHLDLNSLGDDRLLGEIWRVKPLLHVYGHIHAGRGVDVLLYDDFQSAYESVFRGKNAIRNLALMTMELGKQLLFGIPSTSRKTILVNAAVAGGLMDRERRPAIVIRI